MKVYRYIFFKALLSVLGVTLIISLIDISFNFFSQIEDQYGYLSFPTMRNSIGHYSFEQREKREEEMLVSAFQF